MKINDTWRRLALAAASLAACATAGLATTGCRDASPTLVDCSNVTSTIQYQTLSGTTGPAVGNFVADAQVGLALAIPAPKLALDLSSYPAACVEHPTFSATALPDGLTIDTATGAISGTPTTAGLFTIDLSVTTSNTIGGMVRTSRVAFEIAPAATMFTSWSEPRQLPGNVGTLALQGGALVFLQPGASTLDVYDTGDNGITWSPALPFAAPPTRTGFHVATDELGRLYVAGGTTITTTTVTDPVTHKTTTTTTTTARTDLWVWDGSTWTDLTDATPFPTDAVIFQAGASLYAVNGAAWRSDDHGVTWNQVGTVWSGTTTPVVHPACGTDLGGAPLMIGESINTATGTPPVDQLWTSSDSGATWTAHVPATGTPYDALGGTVQCAAMSGRLVLVSLGEYTDARRDVMSSADLAAWQFEPRRAEWTGTAATQGLVVLANTLYFANNGLLYVSQP